MTCADADILTVYDLAELLNCDKETVAARLISGDLPGVKLGRGWIIPRQALFERLNEKAHQEAADRRTENTKNIAHMKNRTIKNSSNNQMVIMNAMTISARGKKRRIPPTLPPLAP